MGPGDVSRRTVPLAEAGGWRDDVTAMNELVASHPTLEWHRPASPGGPHAATWQDGDGPQRAERDKLGHLVDYLTAKLEHEAVPRLDQAYTVAGPLAGRLLDMRRTGCWPAEAHCCGCGEMVRRESADKPWEHTGRMPGELRWQA